MAMMRDLIERSKASNKPSVRDKASPSRRPSLPEVERALRAKYHLRYNVLTCRTEFRAVDAADDVPYLPVTKRVYKTWLCELQADGTDFWWMGGIEAVAESMHVEEYHPVMAYFDALPQWDGEDRLTPLMRRLTKDDTMVGYLCRWMLASVLPRIASFIGTSNSDALLSDPTGSRRFLCIEIDESIDVDTPIEYAQLYAQCTAMLERGARHHFTDEEVRDIELRNSGFRRSLPLEELFFAHYRLPCEGEEPLLLSAAEIYDTLYDIDPRTMRGVNRQNFGAELRSFGATRTKIGNRRVYQVKPNFSEVNV